MKNPSHNAVRVSIHTDKMRPLPSKTDKINAAQVWRDFEDLLAPNLNFTVIDRAVYSHLLRHSRLEGKLQFQFSLAWLSRGVRLSRWTTRQSVRRLIARGVLALVERNARSLHIVRLRLPLEVKAVRALRAEEQTDLAHPPAVNIEKTDFMQRRSLRLALHRREANTCFYCLRRISSNRRCLDHVVPQARGGGNSYRNLVSCCGDCNSLKSDRDADEFLRWLYRERRLTDNEFGARLRALDDLAAGKLKPCIKPSQQAGK